MKKLHVLAVALTLVGIAVPSAAGAINYGGIGARPAYPKADNPRTQSIFIYQLRPGQQATDGLKVLNNTDKAQQISLFGVDSVRSSDGSFACAQNNDAKKGVGAWIGLSQDTVTVDANSTKIVPFTVTVPDSNKLAVGEHDGCIAIQAASQTATASGQSGVILSFRTATRVVVTIPGKIVKSLKVTKVAVQSAAGNRYQVAPTLINTGNVSLDTSMNIRLLSVFGNTVSTAGRGVTPILPNDSTTLNFNVNRPFWGGLYRVQIAASYNPNPDAGIGQGKNAPQKTVTGNSAYFIAAPAPLALLIELAVLALIIGLVVWLIRRQKHARHVRGHWEEYTVRAGDTLQKLADERQVSWKSIARTNKLKPPYALKKEQKLKLPPQKR